MPRGEVGIGRHLRSRAGLPDAIGRIVVQVAFGAARRGGYTNPLDRRGLGRLLKVRFAMETLTGDLLTFALEGRFDVIVHGCNCHCQFGRGIAATIKSKFPEAYEADLRTPKSDRRKLGTISTAEIVRGEARFTVVNGYTQFDYHAPGVLAELDAIRSVFRAVKAGFAGRRIGYPLIGAGLAKGDWGQIAPIIDEELKGEQHTLVVLPPGQ